MGQMPMRRALAFLALGVLAVLTSGCGRLLSVLGKPKVREVRPRIARMDLSGADLAFELDIKNPYPFALAAPFARYGLSIEGTEFLTGEEPVRLRVPPWRVGTVGLPVRVTYGALWRTYRRLKDANKATYRLHGDLLVTVLGHAQVVPISFKGTVPIARPPRLRGLRVSWGPASPSGASTRVEADVTNPNVFPIDLRNLRVQLRLGDVDVGEVTVTSAGPIGPGQEGTITVTGRITAADALRDIAAGRKPGKATLTITGVIETSHGTVDLNESPIVWAPFE